jgi:hypothetical protein
MILSNNFLYLLLKLKYFIFKELLVFFVKLSDSFNLSIFVIDLLLELFDLL